MLRPRPRPAAPGRSFYQDVVVTVTLPDTRDFTSCRHPGMGDVYTFTVVLRFDATHALTESNVTPIVRIAGPI